MKGLLIGLLCFLGAASVLAQEPCTQKRTAGDAAAQDCFGAAVALDERWLLVGAPSSDSGASDAGAAYLFELRGHLWTEVQKLTSTSASRGEGFGSSVALDDDLAVVGAPWNDTAGTDAGSVFVYRRQGTVWTLEAQLVGAGGVLDHDLLGAAVAVDGDVLVAGAPAAGSLGEGNASIFRHTGSSWVLEQKIRGLPAHSGAQFGNAVAVCADSIAVGAYLDWSASAWEGTAFVYRFDGVQWNQEHKVWPDATAAGDQFGFSVDLSDDLLVVGARAENFVGLSSGAAYVFRDDGTAYHQEQRLVASDAAALDFFGVAVDLQGESILVGAYQSDVGATNAGAAYLYAFDGLGWAEVDQLRSSQPLSNAAFGASVALGEQFVVLGACGDTGTVADSGAVHAALLEGPGLSVSQEAAQVGDLLTFRHCGGESGQPVMLFVASVAGQPMFLTTSVAGIQDASGSWMVSGTLQSSPGLLDVAFLTVAARAVGGLDLSNEVQVSFR